jgi:hypothetical protein
MTGTTPTFAGDLLALIFNATTIANIAINATSSPITNIYVSLHTADPTSSSQQTTSEAAYTSYARVAVARTSSGWTQSSNTIVPVATISFPAATGGSETESYAGLGQAASGSGLLFFAGAISPTIVVSNGVTPQLSTSSTLTLT